MGLIHSRASKQRDKAEAELAKQQARLVREQMSAVKAAVAEEKAASHDGLPWYRQPTLGQAIRAMRTPGQAAGPGRREPR